MVLSVIITDLLHAHLIDSFSAGQSLRIEKIYFSVSLEKQAPLRGVLLNSIAFK